MKIRIKKIKPLKCEFMLHVSAREKEFISAHHYELINNIKLPRKLALFIDKSIHDLKEGESLLIGHSGKIRKNYEQQRHLYN